MPRHPRRMEISNYFHVIVQGIDKNYIFEKVKYKNKYYELFLTNAEKNNIKILAYCIMDNHVHILVYIENISQLSLWMKETNTFFAQYYNKLENRVGYVFRDRFLSEPIKSEFQLYICMAYIHYNPVKANIVKSLDKYYYSSYNDYIYTKNIAQKEILRLIFGSHENYLELFYDIHKNYCEYVKIEESEKLGEVLLKKDKLNILNQKEIEEICKEMKRQNISNRKIGEILKIGRNKVDRILKSEAK